MNKKIQKFKSSADYQCRLKRRRWFWIS